MSIKVLVITEDPVLDQFVVKPVAQHLFQELGKAQCRVEVLSQRLRGDKAFSVEALRLVVQQRPMFDLYLLLADRDGDRQRHEAKALACEQAFPNKLWACLAWQEVEVWLLALHQREACTFLGVDWAAVREEADPKERFAEAFIRHKGWQLGPGRGRKGAMDAATEKDWRQLLKRCPELGQVKSRLAEALSA